MTEPEHQTSSSTAAAESGATRTSDAQQRDAEAMARAAADALDETRCEHIVILDVRGVSQVTDFIIIASGTSDRQMRTAAAKASDAARELGETIFRQSEDEASTWIVLDLVDVVVHVFEPMTRSHYDLELLWGDAPRLDWTPTGRPPSSRAPNTG